MKWSSLIYNTIITSITQFNSIPFTIIDVTISSGVGNDGEVTTLDFTHFSLLQQINILENSLNGVRKIITKGLYHLTEINIGENSLQAIQA